MKRKVVITGIGVISPIGNDIETFWNNLINGKSGIDKITKITDLEGFTSKIAGEVKDFNPDEYIDKKNQKRMDLVTQYAVHATGQALKYANLKEGDYDPERAGSVVASGIGGSVTWEQQHRNLLNKGPRRVSPFFIPMMIINSIPGYIAIMYNLKGPNFATVSACASSGHAIAEAMNLIRFGYADIMITGGTEASITPLAVAGFCSIQALSKRNDDPQHASRPFDKDRDGFVISEGSAILVLEEEQHAIKRGAPIIAEITGFGMTDDAYHITAPEPQGLGAARAMKLAVEDSGMNIEDVDYINAHGTSTQLNDIMETNAIKNALKDHAYKINVSSTKSMTGHLLGAASAIEAVATVLTIKEGIIPPTINLDNPDEGCDLNYTPNKAEKKEINFALSNSLGFGGHNITLAFRKYNS